MYVLLLLLSVSTSKAQSNRNVVCDGIVVKDKYYDKQLLFKDIGRAFNLVLHELTGKLFFSDEVNNAYRRIMACSLHNKICNEVVGIRGGNAVYYDHGTTGLYFGGYDGIYRYNFNTNQAQGLMEHGKSIWGLFITDTNFFYITYPEKTLYVYTNDRFERVPEVANVQVDNFYITEKFAYFSNSSGLYKVERPDVPYYPPILINNKIIVYQITEDVYGNVYFCANDGLYMADVDAGQVKQVAQINDLTSIVITYTGGLSIIIYSDKNAIYRLSPSRYSEYCYNTTVNYRSEAKSFSFSIDFALK